MDEIVKTFGLGQIELAVLESAPGKFPGSAGRTSSNPDSAANKAASTARPPWT